MVGEEYYWIESAGEYMAGVNVADIFEPGEAGEANAILIAAAPEMLKALKRLVDAVENLEGVNAQCEPHPKSVMHQALAAIAKAEPIKPEEAK